MFGPFPTEKISIVPWVNYLKWLDRFNFFRRNLAFDKANGCSVIFGIFLIILNIWWQDKDTRKSKQKASRQLQSMETHSLPFLWLLLKQLGNPENLTSLTWDQNCAIVVNLVNFIIWGDQYKKVGVVNVCTVAIATVLHF